MELDTTSNKENIKLDLNIFHKKVENQKEAKDIENEGNRINIVRLSKKQQIMKKVPSMENIQKPIKEICKRRKSIKRRRIERYEKLVSKIVDKLSSINLNNYGDSVYLYEKRLTEDIKNKLNENLLKRHNITSYVRTKMIDWIQEIIFKTNCSNETYFLSVNILNLYISNTEKTLSNKDIHLLGMISVFIASKFEDIRPIFLRQLIETIGHGMFSKTQILEKEKEVIETIKYESLLSSTSLNYINLMFCDLYNTYKEEQKHSNIKNVFDSLNLLSIYFSKILLHFESFLHFDCSINALGAMYAAYQIKVEKSDKNASQKGLQLYKDWLLLLTNKYGLNSDELTIFGKEIIFALKSYFLINDINHNVDKYSEIYF